MIMIYEDYELLLKDLCARLPYGVRVLQGGREHMLISIDVYTLSFDSSCAIPRPYLRPMSSMTEEELHELLYYNDALNRDCPASLMTILTEQPSFFDYLNSHHFDYRGLIEKGLAIEAPEGMYKTE